MYLLKIKELEKQIRLPLPMIKVDFLRKKLRRWSMMLRNSRLRMRSLRRKLKLEMALRTIASK